MTSEHEQTHIDTSMVRIRARAMGDMSHAIDRYLDGGGVLSEIQQPDPGLNGAIIILCDQLARGQAARFNYAGHEFIAISTPALLRLAPWGLAASFVGLAYLVAKGIVHLMQIMGT
jgi:hypothetical protein